MLAEVLPQRLAQALAVMLGLTSERMADLPIECCTKRRRVCRPGR